MKLSGNIYYLNDKDLQLQLSKIDNIQTITYEINAKYILTSEDFVNQILKLANININQSDIEINRQIRVLSEKTNNKKSMEIYSGDIESFLEEFLRKELTDNKQYCLIIKNYQQLQTLTNIYKINASYTPLQVLFVAFSYWKNRTLFLIDKETQYINNFLVNFFNDFENKELSKCLEVLLKRNKFITNKGIIEVITNNVMLIDIEEIQIPLFINLHKMLNRNVYEIKNKEFCEFLCDKFFHLKQAYKANEITIKDDLMENLQQFLSLTT